MARGLIAWDLLTSTVGPLQSLNNGTEVPCDSVVIPPFGQSMATVLAYGNVSVSTVSSVRPIAIGSASYQPQTAAFLPAYASRRHLGAAGSRA